MFVVPAAREFMQRYPRIDVDLRASDRKINLYEEDVDVAIRIRDLPNSALRARRLGELRVVVVGTREFFKIHGRLRHPNDLARYPCVIRGVDPEGESWPFRIRGRREIVRVGGRFRTDDAASTIAAVAQGIGLGMIPVWQVRDLVADGTLEVALEEFEDAKRPIFAVSPATKIPLTKTRLFIDTLVRRLRHETL
jgi:DNA-binding transcriptional LysR family regulator